MTAGRTARDAANEMPDPFSGARNVEADPADTASVQEAQAGALDGGGGDSEITVTSSEPEMAKEDRQNAINQSYQEAAKQLREKYLDEFNAYRAQWLKERGIEWHPPLTPAQRAELEVKKLLAEHPELAKKFGVEQ